ncbi:hypothetical protein [Pseudomonas sp. AB12(2023)]|uniref:hypothetical protein n=1 Tax=Pseudomonas sp. AB12(2023) TaxID=3048597 RepID=UPI002B23C013|nr:hypothetical protein [Pseudomonas sp. AB12(2023)]MEB0221354.1 hypothetical protein [Pseudomonas sp. AB12(2023)]
MSLTAKIVASLLVLSSLQGCTTPLAQGQKQELSIYEEKGLVVHDKNVAAAAALGVIPGAGYFYTGHYVLGVTTIPLWVFLGPLWMPFDTAAAAESRNYYATKIQVERSKAADLMALDQKLENKQLTYEQHLREQRVVEAKYSAY